MCNVLVLIVYGEYDEKVRFVKCGSTGADGRQSLCPACREQTAGMKTEESYLDDLFFDDVAPVRLRF